MKRIIQCFLSLRLTVTLLSLSMILVFVGTLAQVDKGIWTVMDQYFRTWIAWIDGSVFSPTLSSVRVPFPGGFLIGLLLSLNLLFVHAKTFRIPAKGRRLSIGIILLAAGIFITLGIIFGWGAASVATTEGDAFWRVFFRLGRGAIAALILFLACWVLYKKRAGMVLLHAGILLLLIGEFLTALFAIEATMTIREGEEVNYLDRSQQFEIAFIDESHPDYNRITIIPKEILRIGNTIETPDLPFSIYVHDIMYNSSRPIPIDAVPPTSKAAYPEYASIGKEFYITSTREVSGASGERNAPAVDIELINPNGSSAGRYILSLWCYPNFVNQVWDRPNTYKTDAGDYIFYFRNRREYTQASNGNPFSVSLIDFVHEKYEGTQTPKDFSSRIRLINSKDRVDRTLKIWMNNPLRYAGLTFYQSGYLPDDKGTILQVVRNDSWMIPYLSCMIVLVGMSYHFIISMQRSRKKSKS